MARRGALTALQAVLAGIGGGASGYIQQEETKRKRFQEEQDRARQEARDLLLFSREAVSPGPLATRAPAPAAPPKLSAGAPPSIVPMQPGGDFSAAMRALEQEESKPSGTVPIQVAGQTLYIPTAGRRAEMAEAETRRLATIQEEARADVQNRLNDVKNRGFFEVYRKKFDKNAQFDANTPYKELIDLEESAAGRASTERAAGARVAAASAGGQPAFGAGLDYSRDLQTIDQFVPSERTENGKKVTVAPQRKLNNIRLAIVREAQSGDAGALATMLAAQQAGQDFTNEMAYYTTAAGIAQAYAIQEQRGRNVSDLDIKNRVRQITVQPEEVGNPEVELLKASRLRQWARALQTGMIPQIQAGQTSAPPRLGVPFAQAGGQAGLPARSSFTTGMAGLPYNASDF